MSGRNETGDEKPAAIDWTAWQGDKDTLCPSIHPDLDEQCSLGNGHAEAHRTTTYWSDPA